jgi:MFS family permease
MPIDLLRSLSHRNFRLFFLGQSISLIGTWMQQVAMQWLVYHDLQKSAWWLGAVAFAGQIPSFFIAPVAGVIVDHTNRHRLVITTQACAMLQAFALAFLTLTDMVTVWEVLLLSTFNGIVNAFDMPGRQAFLTEMIERREDLSNAIALNSSMFNGARLIGPALAGLVLAATSAGVCFLVNALSFLAVLAALLAMNVTPKRNHHLSRNLREGIREGFHYAFGFAPIRAMLLLIAWVSFLSMSYTTLLPVFATKELEGIGVEKLPDWLTALLPASSLRVLETQATTLGLLMSSAGVGALIGALLLASRKTVLGLGRWITSMPALLGAAIIAFSVVHSLAPAMLFILLAGFALMMQMASTNTVLQTIVDEDKRGRVMSLYTMSFMGMAPLGSLLAGYLADQIGAPLTVRLAGIGCIVGSVIFAFQFRTLRSLVRPIYRRMGILPEVATGIQEATQLTTPPESK